MSLRDKELQSFVTCVNQGKSRKVSRVNTRQNHNLSFPVQEANSCLNEKLDIQRGCVCLYLLPAQTPPVPCLYFLVAAVRDSQIVWELAKECV